MLSDSAVMVSPNSATKVQVCERGIDDDAEVNEGIESRVYQLELVEMAKQENVILCLPTGSGKTWISLLLAKHYLPSCIENKKKIVFLANTVQLVTQQYNYFREHIPSSHSKSRVGLFVGWMNVTVWNDKWIKTLEEYDILVMSTQIFLDILTKYIQLKEVELIVFDECHHATKRHPMNLIMDIYKEQPKGYPLPRILGLTASIINGLPKQPIARELDKIELSLVAKAITFHDYEEVLRYATSAEVKTIVYGTKVWTCIDELNSLRMIIKRFSSIKSTTHDEVIQSMLTPKASLFPNKSGDLQKKICNKLSLIIDIYYSMGPYCAFLACRTVLVAVTFKLKTRKLGEYHQLYKLVQTTLASLTFSETKPTFELTSDNISSKILLLLETLYKWHTDNQNEPLCAIVFIQKKLECTVMQWFLEDYIKVDPRLGFIKSQFITATDNENFSMSESLRMTHLYQRKIIDGFRTGNYNLLFSTAILEEGLDVASCNLIIRLDPVLTFRSYVQSMGRARQKNAEYIIFMDETEAKSQASKIASFQSFSSQLVSALTTKALQAEDIDCIQRPFELKPFCPGGTSESPRITENSAIQIVHQYCQTLGLVGREMLGEVTPISYYIKTLLGYKGFIVLPRNAKIIENIEGPEMSTKRGAKRAVFLEACKKLYDVGCLNEFLMPAKRAIDPKVISFFENESQPSPPLPSVNKWKRKIDPEHLSPFSTSRKPYMYEITLQLLSKTGTMKEKLYDFEKKKYATGILTSVSLDMIPIFHLEGGIGLFKVELKNVSASIESTEITKERLLALKVYQKTIFSCLKNLNLKCTEQTVDNPCFFIVPILKNESSDCIDWNLMEEIDEDFQRNSGTYIQPVSEGERSIPDYDEAFLKKGGYDDAIVTPWYNWIKEFYYVVDVSRNENPSSHSSVLKTTYDSYFRQKYGITSTIKEQPLLRVFKLPSQINFLMSRQRGKRSGKKQQQEDACVTLIPEFVKIFVVPASLFTQIRMVPSVLHRIYRFLTAMELGAKISLNSGLMQRPTYKRWDKWANDQGQAVYSLLPHEEGSSKSFEKEASDIDTTLNDETSDIDLRARKCRRMDDDVELTDSSIPISYIHPMNITMTDLLRKADEENERCKQEVNVGMMHPPADPWTLTDMDSIDFARLKKCSDVMDTASTPPIYEIMEAITLASSQDRISLERLEVIGDSFLKYSITRYLFGEFEDYDEGMLTQLRNLLVSNNYLRRRGEEKSLGEILGGGPFYPDYTFLPPTYRVYEKCAAVAMAAEVTMEAFDDVDELKLKLMTEEDLLKIAKIGREGSAPKRAIFGFTKLRDKDVADCVEAMIGAYYTTGGESGALSVMDWVELFGPNKEGQPQSFREWRMPQQETSISYMRPDQVIPYIKELEALLCYKFQNLWLLVEACTHPNSSQTNVTRCFQRLEFLGDAVLDFAVTNHIFYNSYAKTPGELTDLKSALVNNVTFGSLAVRYGFHTYLNHNSMELQRCIDDFARKQASTGHHVTGQFELLTEFEAPTAKDVEVPKVLGDVFESICGAVYMDSQMNLDVTWKVFYRLMENEILTFSRSCPKSPMRYISERGFKFKIQGYDYDNSILCTIDAGEFGIFQGYGKSKRSAKDAAAKLVQRTILSKEARV